MNSANIKTFLSVARCGSISGAAEQLYISQPAVSARLRQLEEELGVSLIERRKGIRTIHLTAQGTAFLPLAERWMSLYAETESFSRQPLLTPLTIASPDSLNNYLLRPLYRRLASPENALSLRIRTQQSQEVFTLIENREAHVGFAFHLLRSENVLCRPLFREKLMLLCTGDFPKRPLSPEELDPQHELYLRWSQDFQSWHDARWLSRGAPYVQLDTASLMADYLSHGSFWCFCPTSAAVTLQHQIPGLQTRTLTESPPDRICYILTHKDPYPSDIPALAVFQSHLTALLRDQPHLF